MQINDSQTNTTYLSDNSRVFWRPSTQSFQDNLMVNPPPNVAFSMIPSPWKCKPSILVPTEFFYSIFLNQTDFALSETTGNVREHFCLSQLSAGISWVETRDAVKHLTIYRIDSVKNINNTDQKCQYGWAWETFVSIVEGKY